MRTYRKGLRAKYGGKCAYCGKPLPVRGWHRDHIQPLLRYKGVRYTFSGKHGCSNPEAHRADNIVAACSSCNMDKSNLDLETWRCSLPNQPVVFWFERYATEE